MAKVTRRNAMAMGALGTLAAAACSPQGAAQSRRVAVIGAGIVGASIAYHLAREGAQVTVLERGEIAGRASRGTFAWLNASWAKQPRHYHRFNQLGLAGWHELADELSIPIKWGGSLEWFGSSERQARLAQQIAEQVEWGEPARMVEREELARLEPAVDFGAAQAVAFSPNDGALDPVLASKMLLDAAVALGAHVKTQCAVIAARKQEGSTLLETSQGDLETDIFVLATGADPEAIGTLAEMEIPQRSTPGVIAVTKPFEQRLNHIIAAPGVHLHQRLDGRLVLGEQDGAPQNAAHEARLAGMPVDFPLRELGQQHAARILEVADQFVPGIGNAEFEDAYIGWRPLPLDGHPVIGQSPARDDAYIAVSHSGVSLAPIIGRLVAQEVIGGGDAELLANYRPSRSFEEIRRY